MAPRPPIFVEENGDVQAYDSLERAELDVEIVDVRNNLFRFFDSEGLVLRAEVTAPLPPAGRLRRLFSTRTERVKLIAPEPAERRPEQLTDILRDFLGRAGSAGAGMSTEELARTALPGLVEAMNRHAGRGR